MANDNLNQLGKYIKKVSDDADRAVKRQNLSKSSVERTRDVFDPIVPFEMRFQRGVNHKRVSVDLEFDKPPPQRQCSAVVFEPDYSPDPTNFRMVCEEFTGLSAGNHELDISLDVYADRGSSVWYPTGHVFVNDVALGISQFYWSDDLKHIMVTGCNLPVNTVTVCFMLYVP